ncbi:MAG: hypothetical protein AAFV72_21445 [Cyanobacteria bacterium J06635_1]
MTSTRIDQYQCPGCRADMAFDPGKGQLQCPYCGHLEAIAQPGEQTYNPLQENDLLGFINAQQIQIEPLSASAQSAQCPGCQAHITFEPPDVAGRCPFCATSIVTRPQAADAALTPAGLIPFQVGRKAALQSLREWLTVRFDISDWQAVFVPQRLKQLAQKEGLVGVYLPFWTYDCHTVSTYQGERGEHYYVKETNREGKSERVQKTRWRAVSGRVVRAFDDVLVPATRSIDKKRLSRLWPKVTADDLHPYTAQYLAGFKAQQYQVTLTEGFELAKQKMEAGICNYARADIGGDEQRVHSVSTQYSQQTFKHILLPVWMLSYRYQGKPYQVMINAQTGEVLGERPFSTWKVALAGAIAATLALILILKAL